MSTPITPDTTAEPSLSTLTSKFVGFSILSTIVGLIINIFGAALAARGILGLLFEENDGLLNGALVLAGAILLYAPLSRILMKRLKADYKETTDALLAKKKDAEKDVTGVAFFALGSIGILVLVFSLLIFMGIVFIANSIQLIGGAEPDFGRLTWLLLSSAYVIVAGAAFVKYLRGKGKTNEATEADVTLPDKA